MNTIQERNKSKNDIPATAEKDPTPETTPQQKRSGKKISKERPMDNLFIPKG